MNDQIDLNAAVIHKSPQIASWPVTVAITRLVESARGGFVLTFDKVIPESWKWPSNPQNPSENYQWTVWLFVLLNGVWHGAGFVEMWQGRAEGDGTLPPILAANDGVTGYVNWWGDVRNLWDEMSSYVPKAGDQLAMVVSAGNARLTGDVVTSVRERSNAVLFTVHADDTFTQDYASAPPSPTQPVDPAKSPVSSDPYGASFAAVQARFDIVETAMRNESALRTAYDARLESLIRGLPSAPVAQPPAPPVVVQPVQPVHVDPTPGPAPVPAVPTGLQAPTTVAAIIGDIETIAGFLGPFLAAKKAIAPLLIIACLAFASIASAQVSVAVHAEWQPPLASPAFATPTSYTVQVDTGPIVTVGTALDPSCSCLRSAPFTVTDTLAHVFTIIAVSSLGGLGPQSSPPLVLPFAVLVPQIPIGAVKVGP